MPEPDIARLESAEAASQESYWGAISVEPLRLLFDHWGRPQYHFCRWCGGIGTHVVFRVAPSGAGHEDVACREHAAGWLPGKPSD